MGSAPGRPRSSSRSGSSPRGRPSSKASNVGKTPIRWLRRIAIAAEVLFVGLCVAGLILWCSIPNTARLADENPTSTAFIDLRHEQANAADKPWKLEWQWRPLGKISRYLRAAVVYAEDANFYRHEGVDWHAIEAALDKNLENGEMSVGGSTITQQLAKNLYLSPSRSLIRKAREMLIAFSLEDHLTKQRILELYLNCAEWGDQVFGAEAAAKHWFGHSAQSLSPSEAARLAIALPNPFTRDPTVHTDELKKKAIRIIRLFRRQGLINATQERQALDEVGASDAVVRPDRSMPPPVGTPVEQPAPSPTAPLTAEPTPVPTERPAQPEAPVTTPDPLPPEETPPPPP